MFNPPRLFLVSIAWIALSYSVHAAGTVTITDKVLHEFKAWGLAGLRGAKVELFLTTRQLDMAAQPFPVLEAGKFPDPLELPPWSVAIVTAQPSGEAALTAGGKPGGEFVWTGQGADDKWSTAANWRPMRVPGPDDHVLLDGAVPKKSVWDKGSNRHVRFIPKPNSFAL